MLYERKTGALRVLARARVGSSEAGGRYVSAGQVNGRYAVWANVRITDHVTGAYVVRLDTRRDIKKTLPMPKGTLQISPAVSSDGTVYYVRQSRQSASPDQLVKKPIGGPAEVLYTLPPGDDNYRNVTNLYVDDRNMANHVYFSLYDPGGIYKLIDSAP
jgi:hypothetical protein